MNAIPPYPKRRLLVIEDSDADFFLIQRTVQKLVQNISLLRCKDGDEALTLLLEREKNSALKRDDNALPELILLDLNMPGTDGRDLLRIIKTDQSLKTIPVIVFSNSKARKDVRRCYQLGANSFIQKPMEIDGFKTIFRRIEQYWLDICQLPLDDPY